MMVCITVAMAATYVGVLFAAVKVFKQFVGLFRR